VIPARPSPLVMRFFDHYVARYLRRRFHRVLVWGRPSADVLTPGRPVVFAMSHASWWDVLVGYHLARALVGRPAWAPMDERQLRRYRVLARLGVYSVDRATLGGLRAYLRYTGARLAAGDTVWMTPQGEIVSPRRRPVRFQAGLGHLVRRLPGLVVVPVGVAYEFLEEPRPEVLVKFGTPRTFSPGLRPAEVTRRLERDLEDTLDALEHAVLTRDLGPFAPVLAGATSTSLVYDRVRALRRWRTGVADPARHGEVGSDPRRRRPA
jgi:1-acyl-sn-glycerol-3-phosphate acyltransferase